MDWLFRPVVRGLCMFESLLDGTVDVAHIAVLNDVLDLHDENQRRLEDANKPR